MSWEESSTTRIICPCGKGHISQTSYDDDWNRTKYGDVIIECEECKKKYKVESEHHSHYYPWNGSWTEYYLTPIVYPEYSGITEESVYGPLHYNFKDIPFSNYLIENHPKLNLIQARDEFCSVHNSAKVTGFAKEVCKEHKRFFNSVKCASIIEQLKAAIEQYDSYFGSYDQRIVLREKEAQERQIYKTEKRKHQIKLDIEN